MLFYDKSIKKRLDWFARSLHSELEPCDCFNGITMFTLPQ